MTSMIFLYFLITGAFLSAISARELTVVPAKEVEASALSGSFGLGGGASMGSGGLLGGEIPGMNTGIASGIGRNIGTGLGGLGGLGQEYGGGQGFGSGGVGLGGDRLGIVTGSSGIGSHLRFLGGINGLVGVNRGDSP